MKHSKTAFCVVTILVLTVECHAEPPSAEKQVTIFQADGKFAGWPAGHGAWNWGNEILVGFSVGVFNPHESGHAIDRDQPEHHVLARSHDGGETWNVEQPAKKGMLVHLGGMRKGITDPSLTEKPPQAISEPIDFGHPDFCMTLRLMKINGGFSRLYYSYDRGRQWRGPFHVPSFGQPGVMARTDYIVNGKRDCMAFLTVAKSDNQEGRVIATQTTDGGLSWKMLAFVGPEPGGFSIMPSTIRLSAQHLLMTTRRRSGPDEQSRRWIDVWRSEDNGLAWNRLGDVVKDVGKGNPPSLLQLADGRLCVTYGVRKSPYEICAKLSSDRGNSWSEPIVLRSDGSSWDIGYTRSVQRPDGKVVTMYYYQTGKSICPSIQATIWKPPADTEIGIETAP